MYLLCCNIYALFMKEILSCYSWKYVFHKRRVFSFNPNENKMCTPCKEEAKMAIHQRGPESAALAMNMMIQQSPTADDTWIKTHKIAICIINLYHIPG